MLRLLAVGFVGIRSQRISLDLIAFLSAYGALSQIA
jgi:hypothetical protein